MMVWTASARCNLFFLGGTAKIEITYPFPISINPFTIKDAPVVVMSPQTVQEAAQAPTPHEGWNKDLGINLRFEGGEVLRRF